MTNISDCSFSIVSLILTITLVADYLLIVAYGNALGYIFAGLSIISYVGWIISTIYDKIVAKAYARKKRQDKAAKRAERLRRKEEAKELKEGD